MSKGTPSNLSSRSTAGRPWRSILWPFGACMYNRIDGSSSQEFCLSFTFDSDLPCQFTIFTSIPDNEEVDSLRKRRCQHYFPNVGCTWPIIFVLLLALCAETCLLCWSMVLVVSSSLRKWVMWSILVNCSVKAMTHLKTSPLYHWQFWWRQTAKRVRLNSLSACVHVFISSLPCIQALGPSKPSSLSVP